MLKILVKRWLKAKGENKAHVMSEIVRVLKIKQVNDRDVKMLKDWFILRDYLRAYNTGRV